MVIKGGTRGNGSQLGAYLLTKADNETIRILEVDNAEDATDIQLRHALFGMSITSELTKSDKGLYHAQINPAYGEDTDMDWLQAADILGEELGLENQRRVIVLHTKKSRTHAHVVWERYDHETGTMVSDSFSRLAQDRARKTMEQVFGHKPTPDRNPHRPAMKEYLSKLWHESKTGAAFIQAARAAGYIITSGIQRSFMVVDEHGRSFDLVRQLTGVKTKDVKEMLNGEKLVTEKEGLVLSKSLQSEKHFDAAQDSAFAQMSNQPSQASKTTTNAVTAFAQNLPDTTTPIQPIPQHRQAAAEFLLQAYGILCHEKKKENAVVSLFADSKQHATQPSSNHPPPSFIQPRGASP